jgi:hypothetical protein
MAVVTPLLEQVLVFLLQDAPVAEVILVLLRVLALVGGEELLAGLAPDAQPLASLPAELRGGAIGRPALAGSGLYDVTAAAIAGRPADPRARLQGLSLWRAVAVSNEHPCADDQRYGHSCGRPTSFGTPRAPSGASHSWHWSLLEDRNSERGCRDGWIAVHEAVS